jgi:hypothetical protein
MAHMLVFAVTDKGLTFRGLLYLHLPWLRSIWVGPPFIDSMRTRRFNLERTALPMMKV